MWKKGGDPYRPNLDHGYDCFAWQLFKFTHLTSAETSCPIAYSVSVLSFTFFVTNHITITGNKLDGHSTSDCYLPTNVDALGYIMFIGSYACRNITGNNFIVCTQIVCERFGASFQPKMCTLRVIYFHVFQYLCFVLQNKWPTKWKSPIRRRSVTCNRIIFMSTGSRFRILWDDQSDNHANSMAFIVVMKGAWSRHQGVTQSLR